MTTQTVSKRGCSVVLRLTPSRGFFVQSVGFRDVSFLAIDAVAALPSLDLAHPLGWP